MSPPRISLVILTFNEIVGLRHILPAIPRDEVDEILAVDGGSTDGSIEYLREMGIPVHLQERRGRGDAFRVAFAKASGDALVFFSPDGNEDPADLPRFRPLFEAGNDIVIATRMVKGATNEEDHLFFRWRKWTNNAFTLLANLFWNRGGTYITDTINGYRGIRRSAWEQLRPDGHNYTIEYQSSIRAMKRGLKIAEFPTHEGQRLDGREGSPSFRTGMEFLKLFFREVLAGRRVS